MTAPLLDVRDLHKTYVTANLLGAKRVVRAVDGVSFAIPEGETLALVGESGCGKSSIGRLLLNLAEPTQGDVLLEGRSIYGRDAKAQRDLRRDLQIVFQDPYASLNPRLTVGELIAEAPRVHGLIGRREQSEFVARSLQGVGLDATMASRYPHQFSGGQRARIGIARALAVRPALLVCDEAVAALDVSVQAQVLNLFTDLREQLGLTYLFISHDLAVVRHLADRVAVMYLGRIVEMARVGELFWRPAHPYTQALLAEAPTLKVGKRQFIPIQGELPSPLAPPSGCHFHPRCPHAMPVCSKQAPALREVAPGHDSACHLTSG